MKFIQLTEHYGCVFERTGNGDLYVIYKIEECKPTHVVSAFKNKKLALKECKYLEKLNCKKYKSGESNDRSTKTSEEEISKEHQIDLQN